MDEIFDTVAGLPVHPLVIHFAVVLVPLAAVGLVVAVLNKAFRTRFAFAFIVLIVVTVPLAFVAKESGESLAERVGITENHESLGEVFPLWVSVLAVAAVVWYLIARRDGINALRKIAGGVLIALSVGVTALSFLVGHSGAEATWSSLVGAPAVPSPTQTPTAAPTELAAGTITASEVSQHATPDDCWTIIDGAVYDMTPFLNRHPGGSAAIAGLCGGDGTAGFQGQHGGASAPNSQLESLKIGVLATP
jgi:cytochrome b involved in lipid metabolism